MTKKRLAVYIRTAINPDSNQIVEHYKKQISQREDCELVEIYLEKCVSGMDKKRPLFKKMIEDAKAKKFDYIICKSIDKFSRDAKFAFSIIAELYKGGIEILFESENYIPTAELLRRARIMAMTLNEQDNGIAVYHPKFSDDEEPDENDLAYIENIEI